jgi:hypothetical protein
MQALGFRYRSVSTHFINAMCFISPTSSYASGDSKLHRYRFYSFSKIQGDLGVGEFRDQKSEIRAIKRESTAEARVIVDIGRIPVVTKSRPQVVGRKVE